MKAAYVIQLARSTSRCASRGKVDEHELLHQYGQLVDATASKSFRDLVPLPAGKTDLFHMLHCCVYPCLATHYYCPSSLESVEYLAKICNDPLLLADPSPGERFACAAVCNYLEYRLADERKGIWLDRSREAELRADYAAVEVEFDEEEISDLNDIRQQMGFGLASVTMTHRGEEEGDGATESISGTLKLSITLHNQGLPPTLYEFIRLGLEHLRGDVAEFVSVCLREEMLAGLKLQRPFETMWSSELKLCDHPHAIYELARRAILMVIRQNRSVSDPLKRWYLNEAVIAQVIQKEEPYGIEKCLQDYKEEIDRHHHQLNLTVEGNVKSVSVAEVIDLPDDPGFFCGAHALP